MSYTAKLSSFPHSPEVLLRIQQFQQDLFTVQGNLKDVLELACQQSQLLTNAAGSAIDMVDGEEMVSTACIGSANLGLGSRHKMRLSLSGQALLSEQMLYCMDSATDPRVDREACLKVGAVSLICAPLIVKNKAVGVIKVIYPKPHAFSEEDIEILRDLAALVSVALEDAPHLEVKKTG